MKTQVVSRKVPGGNERRAREVGRYRGGRFWEVREAGPGGVGGVGGVGALVCVCVYRRGAREVLRRLTGSPSDGEGGQRP